VIAAEYPTDAKIIQTLKRGADIDYEVLDDDIGEDYCSEKLPSVGVHDAISALETLKSYILAQENVSYENLRSFLIMLFFIVYVVLKTSVLHVKGTV
jgi:hypothetical protein